MGGGKRRGAGGGSLVNYHCLGTAWLAGGWREAELSRTHYTGGLEQGPSVQVPVASPVQPVTADTAIILRVCTMRMRGPGGPSAQDGHLRREGQAVTRATQPQVRPHRGWVTGEVGTP